MPESPLDDKELMRRHPLFSRLSGQVIWLLFEEQDAACEDIGAFMDRFGPWFKNQLDVLRRLLAEPDGFLRIRADRDGGLGAARAACPPPCPTCAWVHGLMIPASDPRLMDWLPPYSLGCRARGEFVAADDLPAQTILADTTALPPPRSLHCPSGWLFTHPWAKELP